MIYVIQEALKKYWWIFLILIGINFVSQGIIIDISETEAVISSTINSMLGSLLLPIIISKVRKYRNADGMPISSNQFLKYYALSVGISLTFLYFMNYGNTLHWYFTKPGLVIILIALFF